jgi:hypothetical protein
MLLILQACQIGCGYLMVELIKWKLGSYYWKCLIQALTSNSQAVYKVVSCDDDS